MNFKLFLLLTSVAVSGVYAFSHNKSSTKVATESATIVVQSPPPATTASSAATKSESASTEKHIKKLHLSADETISLQGPIFENASGIVKELKEKARTHDNLYLLIDSPGGSVMDGAAIVSAIESSTAHIHTVCLSLCASMAFIIHQYGYTRLAVDRSILMAHPASGGVQGTLEQMNSRLSAISRFVDKMDAFIAKRAGYSLDAFKSLQVSELWIDAEDSLAKGLLDGIVDVDSDGGADVLKLLTPTEQIFKQKFDLVW